MVLRYARGRVGSRLFKPDPEQGSGFLFVRGLTCPPLVRLVPSGRARQGGLCRFRGGYFVFGGWREHTLYSTYS